MSSNTILDDKLHWYKDAVIYEVHIKAYKDANGDGIGDFEGLMQKLDHLQDLGATAIWLLPFYPSPLRDDGYDIADYYSINPAYGDLEQFKELLKRAHSKNLKVITELVINHTSDQHAWFQRARRAPKGSPERNYYVWTDDPKQYKDARIIFTDFEASNWTWDPVAEQYYWHRFFNHQPDLNYDNPQVQEEVFAILDFWCKLGVDGFRLDAVPYLFERDGTNCENLPETHAFLKKLRAYVDERYPGTLLLAEANMWPEDSASYFGDGDECHMNYHFPVMPRMYMAIQMEDRYPITDIFEQTPEIPKVCQWAMFLRNHDELTLEMVTDEERDFMYKMYVKDPKARINLGIKHRLAPLMDNDRKKIELMNYLLFSLPGTPVLYYGDEIGMGDNYYLGDRNGVRTPMQWSPDRNAGFSDTNPQQLYLPVVTDPLYNYEYLNVELQKQNTSSLFWFMKRMIATRKKYKSFSRGSMTFISSDNPKVLAFTRVYEEEQILVVVNLSRYPQPAQLNLNEYNGCRLKEVGGGNYFPDIKEDTPYFISLSEYQCAWYLLEPLTGPTVQTKDIPKRNDLKGASLATGEQDQTLTEVIGAYVANQRWFGGKGRKVQTLTIVGRAAVDCSEGQATVLLVEVAYRSGLPDIYQMPIVFGTGLEADKIMREYPQAVICHIAEDSTNGILFDALYSAAFRAALYQNMAAGYRQKLPEKEVLLFNGTKALDALKTEKLLPSRILAAEQSNSSIIYGDKFFMKIYRKVDRSINPDLEITRHLTEETDFDHVPPYTGSIEWTGPKGTIVLSMMQALVDNQTDGWKYMLDALKTYREKVQTGAFENAMRRAAAEDATNAYPEHISAEMRDLIGAAVCEKAALLGTRTAEMHLALFASTDNPAFAPEEFSQHYQRSLYSSFQSGTRSSLQLLEQNLEQLPEDMQSDAKALLGRKTDMLNFFKHIYRKKFDIVKIRIHGDFHLGQTMFKGPDILILDFEGEPARSYSERRLKRSGLRDIAGMIRSFSYASYNSLAAEGNMGEAEFEKLLPYMEQWERHISGLFLHAYLQKVSGTMLVPDDYNDMLELLRIYILEKAVYELGYELNNRPAWAFIPIKGIKAIIN